MISALEETFIIKCSPLLKATKLHGIKTKCFPRIATGIESLFYKFYLTLLFMMPLIYT